MKRKILVVDDSEIVLGKAREALVAGGYDVNTALSAMEADSYLYGADRPDLVIMDVMMPQLDGDKKAKLLKLDDKTKDIPILLLSSKSEDELVSLARDACCDGFIRKPFSSDQLVAKVAETLR